MHEYSCEQCGVIKYAKYKSHTNRFCSHQCANKASIPSRKGAIATLNCQYCKEDFELLESQKRSREKQTGKAIKFCSRKCDSKSKTKNNPISCLYCSKTFKPYNKATKYCSTKCFGDHQRAIGIRKKNGFWYENGYKVLYLEGNKSIKEHINIMEIHLGRKLKSDEIVHHINEIRNDNRLENLQVMTRGDHSKLHRELELMRGKSLFTAKK